MRGYHWNPQLLFGIRRVMTPSYVAERILVRTISSALLIGALPRNAANLKGGANGLPIVGARWAEPARINRGKEFLFFVLS